MEFLDEETRPRFLFQSRATPSPNSDPQTQPLNKTSLFISISISSLLFASSIFFLPSEPLQSLLFWLALSLLLGPFAPSSITGGDIRVGRGSVIDFPTQDEQQPDVKNTKLNSSSRRQNIRSRRSEELGFVSASTAMGEVNESAKVVEEKKSGVLDRSGKVSDVEEEEEEEREWSEEDFELLKKQMVKHPVGKPRRWEVIAEAFRGRHGVESVVKMAKSMSERRIGSEDSFARFLKDRKPLDKRVEAVSEEGLGGGGGSGSGSRSGSGGGELGWNAGEDIALLNALKAFPKDVSMRWEKIAAAVPGKSKNACMKRVAELKRDFRSSKATSEA
ncbi:hypothetical protein L1049_027120 [Liquidambar formosana]|uniref:Myb-like domain-containing protein n=1 Tax=Liquidambar formosana TaxID=63359 RepID=A0AAP0N6Y2_LIQFO